jgi:hypothetical protein
MWIAGLGTLPRFACVFFLALIFVSFAFAANRIPPNQQLQSSADSASNTAPYMRPIEQEKTKHRRVADKKFIGVSALAMGLTIADIETTQHCLGNGTCKELNPLMPHSRAGMYAVNVPVNALAIYMSYRLKANGHRTWWIAPIAISGAHGVGAGFIF